MNDGLPLVFLRGSRALLHDVDPNVPIEVLMHDLEWYFGDGEAIGSDLFVDAEPPRSLERGRSIGEQVQAHDIVRIVDP